MYECMYIYLSIYWTWTSMCKYVCMYVCMNVCIYVLHVCDVIRKDQLKYGRTNGHLLGRRRAAAWAHPAGRAATPSGWTGTRRLPCRPPARCPRWSAASGRSSSPCSACWRWTHETPRQTALHSRFLMLLVKLGWVRFLVRCYAYMYVCIYVFMNACMYARMYVYMYVCKYVWIT